MFHTIEYKKHYIHLSCGFEPPYKERIEVQFIDDDGVSELTPCKSLQAAKRLITLYIKEKHNEQN